MAGLNHDMPHQDVDEPDPAQLSDQGSASPEPDDGDEGRMPRSELTFSDVVLRPRPNVPMRGVAMDTDETGDYDPVVESQEKREELKRKREQQKRRRDSVLAGLQNGAEQSSQARPRLGGSLNVQLITTHFCYPITFDFQPQPGGDCHFCLTPLLPIVGYPIRTVKVCKLDNQGDFHEVGPPLGTPSTNLCKQCTSQRTRILNCGNHYFPVFQGVNDMPKEEKLRILDDVCEGGVGSIGLCCSLCINSSVAKCARQPSCGFQLCHLCLVALQDTYNSDLNALLRSLQLTTSIPRPFGLRADLELLQPDGVLSQHLQQTNGMVI